ncbi:hypothetical protein [Larkinella sp. C7]|uniref:hypothetical protein n=1 Tax=Larkinella sp. C7 TaxID=2576607 RepID=UPI00111129EB|nr:hypothetical protein [Larkinella sp. C7]
MSVQSFCLTLQADELLLLQGLLNNCIIDWLMDIRGSRLSPVEMYHLDEIISWESEPEDYRGAVNLVLTSFQLSTFQELIAEQQINFYCHPQKGFEDLENEEVRAMLYRVNEAVKVGFWVVDYRDVYVLFRHMG